MSKLSKYSLKYIFILPLISTSFMPLKAQIEGCVLDSAQYNQSELAYPLMRNSLTLPRQFSLKKFTPDVKDQGNKGNCVAWAVAYAARTILLAIENHWEDKQIISEQAFSPYQLYAQVKPEDDHDCIKGISLYQALNHLKNYGVSRLEKDTDLCEKQNSESRLSNYSQIKDFRRLFDYGSREKDKIACIKKSLSENKPVVTGIKCCLSSFKDHRGLLWKDEEGASSLSSQRGHALTVIGYDDDLQAFELMNSWGKDWGNNGYTWISYKDFAPICVEAYEMIGFEDENKIRGEIRLVSSNEKTLGLNRNNSSVVQLEPYLSAGVLFRVMMNVEKAAYVYLYHVERNSMEKIFPLAQFSPYFPYQENEFILPADDFYMSVEGKQEEYLLFIIADNPIDTQSVEATFMALEGSVYDRVFKMFEVLPTYGSGILKFELNKESLSSVLIKLADKEK